MSLLEQSLPNYEVNEVHSVDILAPPERVYGVLMRYRFGDSLLFKFLFGLRKLAGWPGALFRPRTLKAGWNFEEPPILESKAFVKVAEVPNEEIVMGLIGKFWQPAPKQVILENGDAFLRFDDPTYGKAAMNFRLVPDGSGLTRLSTETRVHTPDRLSRMLFRLYWTVIGFFSGVIRVDMLRRIKREAEKVG